MTQFRYLNPTVIQNAAKSPTNVYPYAEYRPIGEAITQPSIHPWSFILHTMGGPNTTTPNQLWLYWNRGDVTGEAHLALGYGTLIQALPFTTRADNNAKANRWWVPELNGYVGAVSVETQDNGYNLDPGIAKAPWNQFQMEHLAGISAFLKLRYNVPIARPVTWDGRGIDGHRRFPEWSIYTGKSCPGDARWAQIPTILAWANEIINYQATKEPVICYNAKRQRPSNANPDGLIGVLPNNPTFVRLPDLPANAVGAFVNITAVKPGGAGYLVAWDGIGPQPDASNIDLSGAGIPPRENLCLVPVSSGGITVLSTTAVSIIVDLQGHVLAAA
jgi:hypothetical protein